MKKILVTGGTVFVSRYIAEYYVAAGYEVYVLNRNTKVQSNGVKLIEADRNNLGDKLCDYYFDVVIDNGYTSHDVDNLLDALGDYGDYIFISSSAVYPEYELQPFSEESKTGVNKFWGKYGTDKIEAENILIKRNPNAYIIRPPYLYGPMNNVYREAFVFDCAMQDRKFYLPKDGNMKLQFFHINDLCRFIDVILDNKPQQHIFNVGNQESITVREWVKLCYDVIGKTADFENVYEDIDQRNYFSFYNYEYSLDVSKQYELMPEIKPLREGLKDAFEWYIHNGEKVNKKGFIEYIDTELKDISKNNNALIQKLIGNVEFFDISNYDCYLKKQFGVFIPILFDDTINIQQKHKHPAYEIIINFSKDSEKPRHYWAEITSPNVKHNRNQCVHCYSIFIDKEYFETRFKMYDEEIPVFDGKCFEFCSDILKALNTFVFEYSKSMINADITLDAQIEIITHWLIRSLFGETLDMRAVSSNYSIARAQHYIEQHYMEHITVEKLSNLGYMSKTTFNRRFKNEIGITPIEYLIEVRIKMSKLMLKRKENQLTDIAIRCGFGSGAYFSSCFQKYVGLTPSEYRDKYAD